MKPGIEIKQKQVVTIIPKMQALMRFLHMNSTEMLQTINEKLNDNPFLDKPEEGEDDHSSETRAETRITAQHSAPRRLSDPEQSDVFALTAKENSFKDHLHFQVCEHALTPRMEQIIHILIDSLDDKGYFKIDPVEIVENTPLDWRLEESELEEALVVLKSSFDPPGAGSVDLRESFIYQLKQQPLPHAPAVADALDIVTNHYETFLHCRTALRLSKTLHLPRERMDEMMELLRKLRPYPSFGFPNGEPTMFVSPDVRVYKDEESGRWKVEAIKNLLPTIVIKQEYLAILKNTKETVDPGFKAKAKEAEEFLELLELRENTILKVAEHIVEVQNEFFDKGEVAMRPLTLHDISLKLDVNESTISRSIRQKYLTCPKGLYEFKYFFSKNVGEDKTVKGIDFQNLTESDLSSIDSLPPLKDDELLIPASMRSRFPTESSGDEPIFSNMAIKAQISKIIEEENKAKPLSDEAIRKTLKDMNIHIARRTITKYREEMGIPAAFRRKC